MEILSGRLKYKLIGKVRMKSIKLQQHKNRKEKDKVLIFGLTL